MIWFDYNEGLRAARAALLNKGFDISVIYGKMSTSLRQKVLSFWKAGNSQVLLAQPRCLQYGVNLSEADTQIYFTTPLSGEIYQQSRDRILRAGDEHPLLTIFLLAKDSIDGDIVHLVQNKCVKAVSILDVCSAIKRRKSFRKSV